MDLRGPTSKERNGKRKGKGGKGRAEGEEGKRGKGGNVLLLCCAAAWQLKTEGLLTFRLTISVLGLFALGTGLATGEAQGAL